MFTVGENGQIEYNEALIDDGTLFSNNLDPEQISGTDLISDIQGLSLEPEITVSSGDAAAQQVITYNVYAVPSSATGFPNSSSVTYLEDVVQGYPLDYGYVAYRTSDSYAQSMILFIGPEYSYSGNQIEIQDCDIVELEYVQGSGYSNYYIQRSFSHEDLSQVTISDSSLVYTNIIPGYAAFETTMQHSMTGAYLIAALIGAAASFILGRLIGGVKHV